MACTVLTRPHFFLTVTAFYAFIIFAAAYLTGANGVMQGLGQIYNAVLTKNEEKLQAACQLITIELAIANTKSGILEDYSYQFHDQMLYTGGYGDHCTTWRGW